MTDPRCAFHWQGPRSIMHTPAEERRAQALDRVVARPVKCALMPATNLLVPLTGHATHQIAPPYSAEQQDKRRKLLKAGI